MLSTKRVMKNYGKVDVTHIRIHVEAQQMVKMPNGSGHNLGRRPNNVAKKKSSKYC